MAQGQVDDDENELHKAWTMEMLMNDGDISMSMMNEEESMSEDEKKFLNAKAIHSNHSIQYERYTQTTRYNTTCTKKLNDKGWSMNTKAS